MSEEQNTSVEQPADKVEVADEVVAAASPEMRVIVADPEMAELFGKLQTIEKKYGKVVWDVTTRKSDDEARQVRKQLVTLRTSLERRRKELNEADQNRIKGRNDAAKTLTARVAAVEDPIDEAIKAEEKRKEDERVARQQAEEQRIAGLHEMIANITDLSARAVNMASVDIEKRITMLEAVPIGEEFQELKANAYQAKAETLDRLRELLVAAKEREELDAQRKREREELERLREEQAERARRDAARAETERQEHEAAERLRQQQQEAERVAAAAQQARNDLVADMNAKLIGMSVATAAELRERIAAVEAEKTVDYPAGHEDDCSATVEQTLGELRLALIAREQRDEAEAERERMDYALGRVDHWTEMFVSVSALKVEPQHRHHLDSLNEEMGSVPAITEARFGRRTDMAKSAFARASKAVRTAFDLCLILCKVRDMEDIKALALSTPGSWTDDSLLHAKARLEGELRVDEKFGEQEESARLVHAAALDAVNDLIRRRLEASAPTHGSPLGGAPAAPDQAPRIVGFTPFEVSLVPGADGKPAFAQGGYVTSDPELARDIEFGRTRTYAPTETEEPHDEEVKPGEPDTVSIVAEGGEPIALNMDLSTQPDQAWVSVPVLLNHDATKPIGSLNLKAEFLPGAPNFVFSLGYGVHQVTGKTITDYELIEVSLQSDAQYFSYLMQSEPALGKLALLRLCEDWKPEDNRPYMTTGEMVKALGFPITAELIQKLGVEPQPKNPKTKGVYWAQHQLPAIARALILHLVERVQQAGRGEIF